jgi:hypothetical protein
VKKIALGEKGNFLTGTGARIEWAFINDNRHSYFACCVKDRKSRVYVNI